MLPNTNTPAKAGVPVVPPTGIEPVIPKEADFKSAAFASFAMAASKR